MCVYARIPSAYYARATPLQQSSSNGNSMIINASLFAVPCQSFISIKCIYHRGVYARVYVYVCTFFLALYSPLYVYRSDSKKEKKQKQKKNQKTMSSAVAECIVTTKGRST